MSAPQELNLFDLLDALAKERSQVWTDALLLTFNFEAPFFEGRVLGRLRALGARVAVLADAGVWDPDPMALSNAGHSYLLSPMVMAGAFHPKLTLLLGDDRALALIGSGNISRGGWAFNAELWNIYEAISGEASPVLFELVHWLQKLGLTSIGMSAPARQRLHDVAAALRRVLDGCHPTEDGSQLITNLDRAIVEGLPHASSGELLVGSPFVDGRAMRVVVDRIQPTSVTWMVQERLTNADLAAVRSELASGPPLTVLAERPSNANWSRIRHAKFIEWRTLTGWASITGSPNLTTQALTRTLHQGGNVELAVLRTSDRSLWPDPTLDPETLHPVNTTGEIELARNRPKAEPHPDAGPLILSAVPDCDSLVVTLALAARKDCVIEACIDPLHDRWEALGTIPAGETSEHFPSSTGVVRLLRASYGAHLQPGPVTPATDIEAVQRVPGRPGQDPGAWASKGQVMKKGPLLFLQALNKQLQTIQKEVQREESTRDARPILAGRTAPDKSRATDETRTAWHWDQWEKIGANRHGDGFRRFARGLPAITSGWGDGQPSENFDESEDAPPNGDTGQSLEDDAEVTTRPGPWELEQEGIKLCVARLRQYAALKESIPSPDFYLAVAQVTLYLYTMNAWSNDDPEPVELLGCFLQHALDAPDQLLPADSIKTLGEIARTLVAPRTDFSAGTEASLAARALFTTIERTPGALDARLLDEMLQFDEGQHLLTATGTPLTSMSVLEAIDAREARGSFNDAVRVAESLGLEPTVNSPRTLTITGRFTDHVRLACQLLEGHKGPVAVRLVGNSRRFTILWRDPDLFVITHKERPRWEHFRSPRGLTGLALAEQPRRVPHGPLLRPIVEAEELAQDLGMNMT